ncbi:MAG: diguanylate cyclase, partial [Planctomycetota bacterium]
ADVLLDGALRREVGKREGHSYLVSTRPYSDHRGARTGVVVEFMDITNLEATRTQLARSEQQFRQLAENISEIFWIRDVESGAFRYISPAFETVWARSTEEVLDDEHCWWRWVHDADRERAREELGSGLHRFDYSAEYRVVRADGQERWIRDRGFPIEDADGVVRLMAGLAEDITELKAQEQELIAAAQALDGLAHHDPLTGVLNRRGLERELVQERSRASRAGDRLVAILCDCDDFKRVNDRLGHAAGDAVLQTVSHTLERTLRPTDHLARVGGDEFIALLSAARLAEAVQVAERLRRAISETVVRIGEEAIQLTASFGVSGLPEDLGSVEELVAHSQRALAASKRRGKNQVSSVDSTANEDVQRVSNEADGVVQGLLEGSGLTAFAQPLVRLTDSEVIGYELLIRGPEGAFHDPESLFGLAMERNILTLTDLAALQTCLAAAREHIRPDAKLHVNLLPSTLLDLTDERVDELFDLELEPSRICVEISEQQFIGEPSYLEAPVQRLRRRGLGVALDDVGFGRSSLETLVLLEPEVVKLDRSQVTGAARSPQRLDQLRRLVKVARHGCQMIVAEGVEFEEDEQVLLELGIETAQGFRLGRPHPVVDGGGGRHRGPAERRRREPIGEN